MTVCYGRNKNAIINECWTDSDITLTLLRLGVGGNSCLWCVNPCRCTRKHLWLEFFVILLMNIFWNVYMHVVFKNNVNWIPLCKVNVVMELFLTLLFLKSNYEPFEYFRSSTVLFAMRKERTSSNSSDLHRELPCCCSQF